MLICNTVKETRQYTGEIKSEGKKIGFVPTMGALHQGHISLINKSVNENSFTVASIFVNPIQFNNPEDLEKYPREEKSDIVKLKQAGCDLVFMPSTGEIYPDEIRESYDFGYLENIMEGKFRPGHFQGVAVVVKRLFDIIGPHRAYFGEKDYQQLVIIKTLVKNYNIPVEIIPCQTVRDQDGLAMSSRNSRLIPEERAEAPFIYQVLQQARSKTGSLSVEELKKWAEDQFTGNSAFSLEYFEIADSETLLPLSSWSDSSTVIACVAAWLGKVRLIDNIILFS